MNLFEPPLIGPFVERSNRNDEASTGAAITWTSGSEAYRVDLIRLSARSRSDYLGFEQIPDLGLEEFLWRCFESNNRLTDFLNELTPFIRPSGGAPSPAAAGQWLNPSLVAKGFSLGIAKIRGGHTVRSPVIWVFGGDAGAYGSRSQYSLLGFIDWTPSETKLLQHSHCWGFGARALRRLLLQSVDRLQGPLLTEAGDSRMRQLLSWWRPKTPTSKLIPYTQTEKDVALRLRQSLYDLPNPLPAELKTLVDQLPEKAYASLLRTCVRRGLPKAARSLLFHRTLPVSGREKILEQFIDAQWLEIWSACANEATSQFTVASYGYNALLHRVVETGNCALLQAVLDSFTTITARLAQYLLEKAYQLNRADIFNAVLAARVVQPVRSDCLVGCFKDCLFDHRQSQPLALHLLELGVRPIQSIKPNELFDQCCWMMEDRNYPVLKRALELEPPTHESLSKLLSGGPLRPGPAFDLLRVYSRNLQQHQVRMSEVAFRAATSFIWGGESEAISLLNQAFQEGASLKEIPVSMFETSKLLTGHEWRKREGNWIDLIGLLLKAGRLNDAEAIKKFKRSRSKQSGK